MRHSHLLILLGLVFFLTACERNLLLKDLSQNDANEILVLLAQNGVSAEKEAITAQQKTLWTIYIDIDDEQRARELLVIHHLPKVRELGLEGICKESGMIPTPKVEKCRELLSMKGEIINSLRTIPGVVNSDVVLNIPDKAEFSDDDTVPLRPSASVVVQVKQLEGMDFLTEAKVQRHVANAISGMDVRDVSVIISRYLPPMALEETSLEETTIATTEPAVEEPELIPEGSSGTEGVTEVSTLVSLGGMTMEEASAGKFKLISILILAFFLLLSGALIYLLIRMVRLRQKSSSAATPPHENQAVLPERAAMDRLVEETGRDIE